MSKLTTFRLPVSVTGTRADVLLGHRLIDAWRADGIFQIATDPIQEYQTQVAMEAGRRFFAKPIEEKARHVSDLTYSGYIASGQEVTAGEAGHSEIFTMCQDVPLDDIRVRERWPCHGPVPWAGSGYRLSMQAFLGTLGTIGERLLRLTALGLGLASIDALSRLTVDGWHHLRVLRFPAKSARSAHGLGAHTDHGLLVIAAQDEVGGLYVRPPVEGEERNRNWLETESTAGRHENEGPWTFVRPVPGVLTVFPGDIMQFLTDGHLLSTPHKVALADRERHSLAYFHEPAFESCLRPLNDRTDSDHIHYGTHFTNMFMRTYPEQAATRRIRAEDRLSVLEILRAESLVHQT